MLEMVGGFMSSTLECLKFEEGARPLISGHLDFTFIAGERLDRASPQAGDAPSQ